MNTVHLPENRYEIRPFLTTNPDPVQGQIPSADTAGDVLEVSCAERAANVLVYVCEAINMELEIKLSRIGNLVYFLGIVFQ